VVAWLKGLLEKGLLGRETKERTCSFMWNPHTHAINFPDSASAITMPSIVSFLEKKK
jgi:hypothetical protein